MKPSKVIFITFEFLERTEVFEQTRSAAHFIGRLYNKIVDVRAIILDPIRLDSARSTKGIDLGFALFRNELRVQYWQ